MAAMLVSLSSNNISCRDAWLLEGHIVYRPNIDMSLWTYYCLIESLELLCSGKLMVN